MAKYTDEEIDRMLKEDAGRVKKLPEDLKKSVMAAYEAETARKAQKPVWKKGPAIAFALALLSIIVLGVYISTGKNKGISEKPDETNIGETIAENKTNNMGDSVVPELEQEDSVENENRQSLSPMEQIGQERYLEAAKTEWFSRSKNQIWTHGSIDKDYNITSEDGIYAELVIDGADGNWYMDITYNCSDAGIDYNEYKGLGIRPSDTEFMEEYLRWLIYSIANYPEYTYYSKDALVPVLEEMADFVDKNYKKYLSDAIRNAADDIKNGKNYYCFVNYGKLYRIDNIDDVVFDRKFCKTGSSKEDTIYGNPGWECFLGNAEAVSLEDGSKKDMWLTKTVVGSSTDKKGNFTNYWWLWELEYAVVLSKDCCDSQKGTFTLNNYSLFDVEFTRDYRLERLDNDKWTYVYETTAAETPAESLASGAEENIELNWSDFGGNLDEGTYRLHMTVYGGDVWVEFEV